MHISSKLSWAHDCHGLSQYRDANPIPSSSLADDITTAPSRPVRQIENRRRKEGNVLFNDALKTFLFTVIWRRTYGKGPLG